MSGQLIFMVRAGRSKDTRYRKYPEWYLKVIGEDELETTVSPRYSELNSLLKEIFVHEFLNDWMRERKTKDYTIKRIQNSLPVLLEFSQTSFETHWKDPWNIPLIYHRCNYPQDLNDEGFA